MAFKPNLPLLAFLLLSLFFLSTTLALSLATKDPELKQCKQQCRHQERFDKQQRQQCEQKCEEYSREKQQREREEQQGREGHCNREDPQQQCEKCQRQCREQEQGQHDERQCEKRCEERRIEQEREQGRGREGGDNPRWEGSEEEEEQGNTPYVYRDEHFETRIKTQEGKVRILERFSKRSELLRGIENYRVAILEANPNTFVLPHHCDAEGVFFVVKGRGTISMVCQDNSETFNLQRGDILRVRAGTTIYLTNKDNHEKLMIAKLLQHVSSTGRYQEFFGTGGENPESFYRAFSMEVLEAAFNSPREKIERLFGQQTKGAIVKASQEQIRALSRHAQGGGGHFPFGGESKGPFNLLKKRPTDSNRHGQLYEVNTNECKELEELNLAVSFANITRGSMLGPFYCSKATKVAVVVEGTGYFEMACPHMSSGQQGRQEGGGSQRQEGGAHYQKVSARLSPGVVYVVPAGHPVVAVASGDQNLQILCFDINAKDNEKYHLAGKKNIMKKLEKEAQELSFSIPAREVEEILNKQDETFFFPGPHQRQEGGRAYA
ncbi:hypothetical protein HHK36_020589 [Tetracentron sinense]|uniref:Cupin type-1 domain-containing protein n=1 Tax=Tetracentron sinense TaxID=13715 RepID=A0A835D8Z2_TETSI|nr:hypothetical protein HHK36_020589 [Tetracentron sinense]